MRPSQSWKKITGLGLFYRLLIYIGFAFSLFAIVGGGLAFGRWLSSTTTSQGNRTRAIPGPPEGTFPDLDEIRQRTPARPRAPRHVPSTIRSRRSPLVPWNGIRVGDPLPRVGIGSSPADQRTPGSTGGRAEMQAGITRGKGPATGGAARQMNHAPSAMRIHAYVSPPVSDSEYMQNFFQMTLGRQPYTNESTYWNDMVRAAYAHGQGSMVLAFKEVGKTLFESNDYAARNRNNHDYVYDLYKTYLMREPDQAGWAYWTSVVPTNGRANVRRAFDLCDEFANLVATFAPSGSASSAVSSLATARVDPFNQSGSGLLARDAEWSLPILSLPGRAGLDLGLVLSYSSMVWTHSGPYIYFDEDNGFPGPGFQLGFPTIQERVFDAQVAKNVYVLVTASGTRVELRQTGTSNVYEAADSSYLQLIDNGSSLLVRSTDGTQLTYVPFDAAYRCTKIKDRNGNYITVNHDALGHIANITDTLGRVITFNYDGNANLVSITQAWTGVTPPHIWASFVWSPYTIQPSFSGASVVGAPNGTVMSVITQVELPDNSYFTFEYTNAAQVSMIRRYTSDDVQRAYTAYDYGSPTDDCPRLWQTRVWAENWTGINGVPTEVPTQFGFDGGSAYWMAASDGTVYKEFYGTGWQKRLPARTEVLSADGTLQKWTTMAWTQDDTNLNYQRNPRVTETNVYDAQGNRRRSTTTYAGFTLSGGSSCTLPTDAYEYAADLVTVLRRSHTDYNLNATYTDRRIIGLPAAQYLCDGAQGAVPCNDSSGTSLASKVTLLYDQGSVQNQASTTQHDDSNYGVSAVGRGNLSNSRRHNVTNLSQFTESIVQYNTNGSVIAVTDALSHQSTVSYADSFSDSTNRNSFAYPTTLTDAGGFIAYLQYNYDFGAPTRKQGPPPANQSQGLIQTLAYDSAARLDRITTANNGAYTRYIYGPNYLESYSTVNSVADEARSVQTFDGVGRVIGAARNHPGSSGGYSTRNTIYDQVGRAIKQSNPAETNGSWAPAGDDAAGWLYTQQTYDWKGRALVTTNTDGSQKYASYGGCGCAGGEIVTLTDEVARRQNVYSDVLGRTAKTEVLNLDSSVYTTTTNTYNARDQITQVRQYAGLEGGPTFQDTTMTYDGFGRLKTKHVPEQNVGTATVWDYNSDGTTQKITDARGASQTLSYNNRHLVIGIIYAAPGGSGITVPAAVSFAYDAAGNRTSMTDGVGSKGYTYDQLSRLTAETQGFWVGTYSINYGYNLAGQLTSITDPFGASFAYQRDSQGQLKAVTGSPYAGITNYVTDVTYRAWGAPKSVSYNGVGSTIAYNARMQPAQFRLTHNSNGAGIIRENYGYFGDGRAATLTDLDDTIGTNPPATLRFLSRAYGYDQVGRVTGGYGNGGGGQGIPYTQSYSYDEFGNMTGRSGRYYSYNSNPFLSDSASFTNHRRNGWGYNADGQVIATPSSSTDSPRNMSYDAAGRMITSVEFGQFNITTYSAGYDGDGQLVYESSSTSVTTQTSYIVRSTVLGEVLTRLDQSGNKKITHVPAEGLLFATQGTVGGSYVVETYRNPLGTTETGKGVYDPLGNYIPFQRYNDPRPPSGSYNSSSMSSLSTGQANPDSYGVGCLMDGMPTNCSRVMQAIGRDQASRVSIHGSAFSPGIMRLMVSFIPVTQTRTLRLENGKVVDTTTAGGDSGHSEGGYSANYASWVMTSFVIAPGMQLGFEQNPITPQNPAPGSFYDCFYSSGLAKTHAKGQYADAKLFTQAAANLLLDINSAEGGSVSLLAMTLMNENTTFDIFLKPNTKFKDTEWWDVGPFQLNQHYTNEAIASGNVSNEGRNYLATWDMYGPVVKENKPFTGSPLANGRMAARRLNAASSKSDRQRAINYAGRAGRGDSYDSFAPLFDRFFNCYRR